MEEVWQKGRQMLTQAKFSLHGGLRNWKGLVVLALETLGPVLGLGFSRKGLRHGLRVLWLRSPKP